MGEFLIFSMFDYCGRYDLAVTTPWSFFLTQSGRWHCSLCLCGMSLSLWPGFCCLNCECAMQADVGESSGIGWNLPVPMKLYDVYGHGLLIFPIVGFVYNISFK